MADPTQERIRMLELEAEALELEEQDQLRSGPVSFGAVDLNLPITDRSDLPYDIAGSEWQQGISQGIAQQQTNDLMREGYNQAAGTASRLGLEVAGGLLMPQMKIAESAPYLSRIARYGANAFSQAVGVQGGNEVAQQFDLAPARTIPQDIEDIETNTVVGAAIPAVFDTIGSIGTSLKNTGDRFTESSIGARVKDFTNSRKRTGAWEGDSGALETRLSGAIREEAKAGTFPALRRPAAVESSVTATKEGFGQQIGSIVEELDQVGLAPQLNLTKAQQVVNEAPFNLRADLQSQLDSFSETLQLWDGSARGLHKARSAIGSTAYRPTPNSPAQKLDRRLQQALYGDMTDALDGVMQQGIAAGAIPPERAMQLAEANRRYGNLKQVEDVVTDAALSAQHQQYGPWQRALWTTTGFGVPMAAAYQAGGLPGALSVYTMGMLSRTRAGQAFLGAVSKGGGAAMELLGEVANNPYMVRGLSLAALPRDWDVVKNDPAAKETIAMKMGIPPEQFNSLPEPAQKEIHKQIISIDPDNAEPTPNNLNIVNGEYVSPLEKDAVVKEALGLSPSERAKVIGGSFQNKAILPSQATLAPRVNYAPPSMDISSLNSSLDSALSQPDLTYDNSSSAVLDELTSAQERHFYDDYH